MNTKQAEVVLKNAAAMSRAVRDLEEDLGQWVEALRFVNLDPEQARELQKAMQLLTRTSAQLVCSLGLSCK